MIDALTMEQCAVMSYAETIGAQYRVKHFPALVLTESSAGRQVVGDDRSSFGPAQMTVPTARGVLAKHPRLWPGRHSDAAIRDRLLADTLWALTLGAQHLFDLSLKTNHPLRAYNAGFTGASRGAGADYESRVRSRKWTCTHDNRTGSQSRR